MRHKQVRSTAATSALTLPAWKSGSRREVKTFIVQSRVEKNPSAPRSVASRRSRNAMNARTDHQTIVHNGEPAFVLAPVADWERVRPLLEQVAAGMVSRKPSSRRMCCTTCPSCGTGASISG